MLNYACEAGEACKTSDSYTATLRQSAADMQTAVVGSKILLQTDSKRC